MAKTDNLELVKGDYLKQGHKPLETDSSILVSSSIYLNDPVLRDNIAQECLRKAGWDLPLAYLLPEATMRFEALRDKEKDDAAVAFDKANNPEFAKWLDERYLSHYTIDMVKDSKPGTLGYEVRDFMLNSGLDLNFFYGGDPIQSDYHYLMVRTGQSHDIEHMVTGLQPDPAGELGMVCMHVCHNAAYFSEGTAEALNRLSMYLVGPFLMRTGLHSTYALPTFLEGIRLGTQMGKQIKKSLRYVRWEEYFDVSIKEIRQELNIDIPGLPGKGEWDWVFDAARGGPQPKAAD